MYCCIKPAALDDLLDPQTLIGLIALTDFALAETAEHRAQRLDVLVGEIELRHQLVDPLGRVTARSFEFVISPIVPRFFNIGAIAEDKLFNRFRAESGQLGADAGFFFHSLDVMAAEATPLAHQRFAALDVVSIGEFFLDPGERLRLCRRESSNRS